MCHGISILEGEEKIVFISYPSVHGARLFRGPCLMAPNAEREPTSFEWSESRKQTDGYIAAVKQHFNVFASIGQANFTQNVRVQMHFVFLLRELMWYCRSV
jgi:hypothetical protein